MRASSRPLENQGEAAEGKRDVVELKVGAERAGALSRLEQESRHVVDSGPAVQAQALVDGQQRLQHAGHPRLVAMQPRNPLPVWLITVAVDGACEAVAVANSRMSRQLPALDRFAGYRRPG